MRKETSYEAPLVEVMILRTEGVICTSEMGIDAYHDDGELIHNTYEDGDFTW